jgi:putative ABC transport system substrate-binding protein
VREVKLQNDDVLERVRRTSPDVVVAIGTEAFRKMRSLRDVPLVHVMVIPAEAERGPAGTVSGVSMDIAPGTWLRSMRRLFPNARRAGLLFNPENTGAFVAEAQRAAPDAGVELVIRKVQGPDDVPQALNSMRNGIDLLWMLPDPTIAAPPMAEHLLRYSIQHRIPIMTFSRKYLDMGAVASLDVDPIEMGLQAGELVNRIAREGRDGGSRYARKPRLSINGKAAEKMGITLNDAAVREPAVDD